MRPFRQVDSDGKHVVRIESEVEVVKPDETLDQQHGASHQYKRNRDLEGDQQIAHSWRVTAALLRSRRPFYQIIHARA